MPVPIIAAGIAAAGAIGGGAIAAGASKRNAKTAAAAQASQEAAARENRDFQYGINLPTINYGRAADDRIAGLLNIGGDPSASSAAFDQYKLSTGYDTRLREGLQSVNQRAFAGGAGQSGAALKALQTRGADVAGRYFDTYLGQLGGVSSTGANARGLVAGVGNNATNQLINASQTGAQNQMAITQGNATNTTSALQNVLNAGLYAYGSSYGNPISKGGGSDPSLSWANPFGKGY